MLSEVIASLKIPHLISACLTKSGNTLTRDEVVILLSCNKHTAVNIMQKLYKDRINNKAWIIELSLNYDYCSSMGQGQTQITITNK
jgi:hypothetical protein